MQAKFNKAFVPATIILTGILAFGLGRLSRIEESKLDLVVENAQTAQTLQASHTISKPRVSQISTQVSSPIATAGATVGKGTYVASKNGTRYYLLSCSGVSRISEANKIYFATKAEAEARGLMPAANCPGL